MRDSNLQDGFKELLQMQQKHDVPDFMEQSIMAKIEPLRQKALIPISLQSIFILSSLSAVYLLLLLASVYYYPNVSLLQDLRMAVALIFLIKLSYDLNEILPGIFQQFHWPGKVNQSKPTS